MSSRCRSALAALALLGACEREERILRVPPEGTATTPAVRTSHLLPGPSATPADSLPPDRVTDTIIVDTLVANTAAPRRPYVGDESPYENVAHAISEGKQLYEWMNCSGCHAEGGGGIGPALIDEAWRYGSAPMDIYQTIVQGRPNGMPSFGGRLSDDQVWKLVAFVRSMSAMQPAASRSGRSDDIRMRISEQRLERPTGPGDTVAPPRGSRPRDPGERP